MSFWGMKVLVDAGHGIDTPGKRSPDGSFREYLWNRQVADLVLAGLKARRINASLLVTETNDISLTTRCRRANAHNTADTILLSIHSNAAGNGSAWQNATGWSCYTSPGKTKSDALAEALYSSFSQAFPERKMRKDTTDGDSDIEANFTLLTKTKCPAVLIENFFYDNKEECKWLLLDTTKQRIADAIVGGVLLYLANL